MASHLSLVPEFVLELALRLVSELIQALVVVTVEEKAIRANLPRLALFKNGVEVGVNPVADLV